MHRAASETGTGTFAEPPGFGDISSYDYLRGSTREIDRAVERNDFRTVDRLMDQQLSEVMQGLLLEDYQNGRTGSISTRRMAGAHSEANLAAVSLQIVRRNQEMEGILEAGGWGAIEGKANEILRLYKERNGADKVEMRAGMSEQEMAQASMQFEPVMVDPNEIANFRQQLVKLDQQLRPLGTSVFTDPRTSRVAAILQNSAEPGRPGYLADAEQDLNQQLDPFTKYVGLPVVEGIDAFVEGAAQVGVGARSLLHDMGLVSLDGLSQGNADALYNGPTSWVQDSDGSWYHNGGKVGAAEVYAGVWYSLTGELIDQQMADYADAKARMAMQSSGVQGLAVGLGQFMGSMGAFMGTGGPAMKVGSMLTKGLGIAVTGGKAAQSLSRTEKLVRILAERSGAAAALGAVEATKSGRIEGYGKAMLHGTVMAVPMMVMGALGDRLERTLRRYKHLPGPVAATLAGAVEGIGLDLGTWEAGFQFVNDPSNETFAELAQKVMVNAIGNGILRGSGITGAPPVHEFGLPPDVQKARKQERRQRAMTGNEAEVATERGAQPETVRTLGDAAAKMQASVGTEPEAAIAAKKQVDVAEKKMDVEEAGLSMTQSEKLEARYATREELDRLKDAPNTPEKRQEIIKLLNQSRMAFGKGFADFVKKNADQEIARAESENDAAKQLMEAADVVKALLGDRDASSYKAQRKAKLAEELAKPVVETVPGAEPGPLEPIASKSKITPLEEMVQEGGKTGLEPDATLPPKGPPAPRPVTPEEALAKGLDPETGEPMRVDSVFGGEDFSKPDPANKEATEKWMAERREGGKKLSQEESRRGPESDQWREWDQRRNERVENARKAATDESGFVDQAKFQKLVNEWYDAYPQPKRFEDFDEGMRREIDDTPDRVEARAPSQPSAGTPAALRMQPSLEQEGVAGTEPIRARDVIAEMEGFDGDPVRAPIRKGVGIRGRQSTKGVLGWYSLHEDIVRLKGARDVVVAAHEWSHAMDLKTGATKSLKGLTKAEVQGFINAAHPWYPGYDKLSPAAQKMESWAEFWARHLLDDPTLKEQTGAFHDWAMKWIADPKRATVLAQMQRIQAGLRRYRDQGAMQRVRQSIVFEGDKQSLQELKAEGIMTDTAPAKAAGFIRRTWNTLMRTMVDDTHELKKAQEHWLEIAKGSKEAAVKALAEMDITSNPTRLYDALRMTASKQAEAFLAIGTHDLAGRQTGESLRDIFKDIGEGRYEDFITYLVAKRSMEIQSKGKPTQLHRDDYLTVIEKLENPDFVTGAKRIRAWSDRLIDYAQQGGLFSEKQAKAIKESYKTYIPFQRVLEGPEQHAPGRGVAERGTGVKSLKGGQEEISDPVNALGDMARNIIAKTHQAMVMKAMVKFGIVHKGVGGFITEVKRSAIPKDHPMLEIAEAIRRAEGGDPATAEQLADNIEKLTEAGELGPAITLFGQQVIPKGSRPIIAYTPHFTDAELATMTKRERALAKHKSGKLLWLEVDVAAYEALMGIDVPQTILDKLPAVVQNLVEAPSKLVRLGATVLSPGFAVRNTLRDIAGDYVYTSGQNKAWLFSGVTRFAKGMIEQRNSSEAAQLFDALGGGVSTFFSGEVAAGRTSREMLSINRNWWGKLRHAMGKYSDWLAEHTEQPLRTEAFARTRERALSENRGMLEANLLGLEAAKEITINFARGGTISRAINRLVPYFNAGIQGNRKFFMTLAGKNGDVAKRTAWIRAITGLTVPTIVLWAMNRDEEWYQELPEWRRFNYWNFKVPGTDEVMSIPKPFELGKLFGNVPEIMLDQVAAENPIGVEDVVGDAVMSLMPQMPIPAIMKPIVEGVTNHDFFTGRQITPEWIGRSREPKDQRTAYTRWFGDVGAAVARVFGLDPSPMLMEHLLDAYTGGMAGRLSDSVTSAGGVTSLLEGEGPRDMPIVGTLFRQGSFEQSRSVQAIFDLDSEFTQRAGSHDLTAQEKTHRRIISRAKDEIAGLKAAARSGTMDRSEADRRAAEIARQTFARVKR